MTLPVTSTFGRGSSGAAYAGSRPVTRRISQGVRASPKFARLGFRHQNAWTRSRCGVTAPARSRSRWPGEQRGDLAAHLRVDARPAPVPPARRRARVSLVGVNPGERAGVAGVPVGAEHVELREPTRRAGEHVGSDVLPVDGEAV